MALALFPLATPASAQVQGDGVPDALNLSGADNVEYSIRWSQVTYTPLGDAGPENPPTEALLGRDDLFADNLAAGSLMGQAVAAGRPLYLTPSDSLDADVLAEMQRVLADGATVNVLGGEDAISTGVETALTDAGFTVNRLSGETRVETAVDIAESRDSDTVLVVRAFPSADSTDDTQAFADSLGAGALAATNGWEILFTQSDVLTGSTETALTNGNYSNAYVVGGTAAISDDVMNDVAAIVSTTRVSGQTRFETAVELNGLREGDLGDFAIMVDGQTSEAWADGFPAANLSGLGNYPVVLSNQGTVPTETRDYLVENFSTVTTQSSFAAHFTDIVLVCGNTVTEATCQAALDAINGNADGQVRPFPPTASDGPTDNAVFTDAPELLNVTMESMNGDNVDLRFTFDESVTGQTPVASCFHLYAFDSSGFSDDNDASDCSPTGGHMGDTNVNPASADGDVAQIATDDQNAVIVNFDVAEEEFSAVSVATVDWNAVKDDDGIENLESAYALQDVVITEGITSAPDLTEVRDFNANTNTVEFVFDEDVATPITDPGGFVLVDDDGDTLVSDSAVRSSATDEENVVVATFSAPGNDESAEASATGTIESTTQATIVRGGALADSVTEDGGTATNPLQVVLLSATNATDDPDLVSLTVDRDQNTITYIFDVAIQLLTSGDCAAPLGLPDPAGITAAPEDCFQVYDRSGTEIPATAAVRATDNKAVVATFADGAVDEALGASVDADAVSAVEGTVNPANEIDELPIAEQDVAAGSTLGPDLVSASVQTTGDLGTQTVVAFDFDEDLVAADGTPITGGTATPDASRFFIYDAAGIPTRGMAAQLDDSDASVVQVTFADNEGTIAGGVVVTVNDLAVADEQGDSNPEGFAGLS
ncbi:MAG: cell wall-binding repeat-containing protein [Euzebya sp.]